MLSAVTNKMLETRAVLANYLDEDVHCLRDPIEYLSELKLLMIAANLPRALWVPHYESLDPYLMNKTLNVQDAANCHDMIDAWLEE